MTQAAFTSRHFTSFDGLQLHYRDYAGPAPKDKQGAMTVLCLPGLTRNARDFEDLAVHLSTRYRVLCADLRGRGGSAYATDPMTYVPATYVRDVAALLDTASVARVADCQKASSAVGPASCGKMFQCRSTSNPFG